MDRTILSMDRRLLHLSDVRKNERTIAGDQGTFHSSKSL